MHYSAAGVDHDHAGHHRHTVTREGLTLTVVQNAQRQSMLSRLHIELLRWQVLGDN